MSPKWWLPSERDVVYVAGWIGGTLFGVALWQVISGQRGLIRREIVIRKEQDGPPAGRRGDPVEDEVNPHP